MKHIISATVENEPGVLARIVGLISGRGYNIETLSVGPTQDPKISQMTMTIPGDNRVLSQVTKQLNKMVDVIEVCDLTGRRHVARELLLVEISTETTRRAEIVELASLFKASIVGVSENALTIQLTGDRETIEDFLRLTKSYTILDLSRSGATAVTRG